MSIYDVKQNHFREVRQMVMAEMIVDHFADVNKMVRIAAVTGPPSKVGWNGKGD